MLENHVKRLLAHVVAIAAAAGVWLVAGEFVVALICSIAVFLAVSLWAQRRFGGLAGPQQLKRSIETMLADRDDADRRS